MPTPAALPQVSAKPRPKVLKGFENAESPQKPANEISEILRAAGEQIGGYKPESVNPIPGHDTLDKLKAQEETFKRSNYASLKERLSNVRQTRLRQEAAARQGQQLEQQKAQSMQTKKAPAESKSKGSLKDRMFGAMGIRRKGSTPSAAETSATREYGAKKTQ